MNGRGCESPKWSVSRCTLESVTPEEPSTELVRQVSQDISDEASRFLGTIFGSASINMDGLLGDRVGWWRFRQAVRLAEKAQRLLADRNLTAEAIPLRTSIPLLEQGSLAEDDDLIDRWASLLANAAIDPKSTPPSYANVLAEIEPKAALVLEDYWRTHHEVASEIRNEFVIRLNPDDLERFGLSAGDFKYHMDNLIRLGLVRSVANSPRDFYESILLTAFGAAFVRACLPPGTPEPTPIWHDADALRAHIQASTEQPSESEKT